MLADDSAPSHAESLTQCLGYARDYAEEIRRMLAEGKPDSDRGAQLVQAIHDVLLAALDDLYELDDVQQEMDAVEEMQGLTDEQLFSAITCPPFGLGAPHAE
ncbi:hypothetical protein N4G69_26970 [Streptomyces mirabilis]|uniref:hypothetical protein n=1 Tax=Streptomyces mirabilis TaxID=68239 RepID=UPI0021C0873A|nr:hypothetical protein [Streptomyces mirabilis]MCT9109208.1 hypothetical protein [Streptomyces mirabilis]